MTALAPTVESFFTGYLIGQRGASAHTIASYRDTLRLLFRYAHERTGIRPSDLDVADLDAEMVTGFLAALEQARHNSAQTRNLRLAAIHSLFRHAALQHPEHAWSIARVLAIRPRKASQKIIAHLSDAEVEALLASPDRSTWTGRRDHLLMLAMITSGPRVSEVTALTWADISAIRPGAHVVWHGKGRKERISLLDAATAAALRLWQRENPGPVSAPVFTALGTTRKMTTDAVAQRLRVHAAAAAVSCPSIATRNLTPHVLRHTFAMRMQTAGIGGPAIALLLGHESPASTRPYLQADLELKQRALDRTAPPRTRPGRYTAKDELLAFLEAL
ncbi:MAG TPA: tyrosine-type recombinase/integrase [Streptosporangiaceae bacterium]